MKREMGSYAFAAQYQQRPAPQGGGLVKWTWFPRYRVAPVKAPGGQIVQSWDTALKAGAAHDWSVCTTWLHQDHRSWLLDLVLVEDQGAGTALLQDLARETDLPLVGAAPHTDKATRLLTVSPRIESGRVLLPDDAPWLADLQHELAQFPNGRHDDQVDSLSQFLFWARERANVQAGGIVLGPKLMSLGGPSGNAPSASPWGDAPASSRDGPAASRWDEPPASRWDDASASRWDDAPE